MSAQTITDMPPKRNKFHAARRTFFGPRKQLRNCRGLLDRTFSGGSEWFPFAAGRRSNGGKLSASLSRSENDDSKSFSCSSARPLTLASAFMQSRRSLSQSLGMPGFLRRIEARVDPSSPSRESSEGPSSFSAGHCPRCMIAVISPALSGFLPNPAPLVSGKPP